MNKSTFIKSVLSAAAALSIIACAEQEQVDKLGAGSYLEMNAEEAAVYGLTSKLNQNTLQSTFSSKLNQKYVPAKSGEILTTGYRVLLIEKDMKKAKLVTSSANFNIDMAQNLKMKTALIKSLKEANTVSLSLADGGNYMVEPTIEKKTEIKPIAANQEEVAVEKEVVEKAELAESEVNMEEAKAEEIVEALESDDEIVAEPTSTSTTMKITRVNDEVIQLMEIEIVSNKMNDVKTRNLKSISYFRPVLEREIKQIETELVRVSGAMKAAQEKIGAKDAANMETVEAAIKKELEKTAQIENKDSKINADEVVVSEEPMNNTDEAVKEQVETEESQNEVQMEALSEDASVESQEEETVKQSDKDSESSEVI